MLTERDDTVRPTTIGEAERAIHDRLRRRVPTLAVESFPDDPEAYQLKHKVGALLVGYAGAKYGPVRDIDATAQERLLSFTIVVIARSLTSHDSATLYMEAVRLALAGYRIPGFGKIAMGGEQFLGAKGGQWMFGVTVRLTTMSVELPDEDDPNDITPLLRRLTFDESASSFDVVSDNA